MTAPALVLLAHGHSDPSIAEITHAMRHELVERLPGMIVRAAYLGSPSPDPLSVVGKMARTGVEEVVVVPLEIGCAWNPSEEARDAVERASAGLPDVRIQLSRPIGPEPTLLPLLDQALRQGLAEHHVTELDGLVLSTAGTSDVRSRAVLARRARQWGLHHKLSCVTAYADDSGPSVEEASAASAPAAGRGAWPRARGTWWRRCLARGRCGNGC